MPEPPPDPTTPASPEPVPLEVPLEQQISDLPPLQFPGSDSQEFQKWAEDRRRRRIRLEIIGGGMLLVGGAIAFVSTQRSAFLVIAVFAVVALAAYELLVNSFE